MLLQHPGDGVGSTWPGIDGQTVARSATVLPSRTSTVYVWGAPAAWA